MKKGKPLNAEAGSPDPPEAVGAQRSSLSSSVPASSSQEGAKAKADAVRLLRQIVAPCDGAATEHGWRKCKRCMAVHGVEMRFPLTMRLLQTAIDSLESEHAR